MIEQLSRRYGATVNGDSLDGRYGSWFPWSVVGGRGDDEGDE
jgi:hypothetical protein